MGTPEFAAPSLKALINSENEVVAVVAQPDKPKGRGRKLSSPPTKLIALQHGIPTLQPEKIRTKGFLRQMNELDPDVVCVVAYGKILPKSILSLPRYGCINVHASLLPKYRGAAPINWAIVRGETITGITSMQMDEGMDTGDMLLAKEVEIKYDDTGESLSYKLSTLGAELLIETLNLLKQGELTPNKQDESQATYAPMIKKGDGEIDWCLPAHEIRNLIRGMLPWPGAYTFINGGMLKIYNAEIAEVSGKAGEVIKSESGILTVSTGKGSLNILELQIEGGKRLDVKAFLSGRKIDKGAILGTA